MILATKLLLIFWALGIGFAVLMVVKPLPARHSQKEFPAPRGFSGARNV
jgi:hypothetical protein